MAIDRAAGANYLVTAADAWHVRDRAFTAMWWVRIDTRPGSGTWWSLASGYEGSSANWVAAFVGQTASNTRFSFGWQTGPSTFSSFPESSGIIVPTAEWMHVALVYYSGSSRAWDSVINGLVNYSVTSETLAWPSSTAASLYLGYDPGNAAGPDGQLAYYRMFEGALTLGEIRHEMHSAVPVNHRFPCSVDISLDPVGGGSQVIGLDRSFRRVHPGTVTGTVNWAVDAPPVRPVGQHMLVRRPWLWGTGAGGGSTVTGAATGEFGFTAPATGQRAVGGAASGAFGFTGTASGKRTVNGSATGAFGLSASASGHRTVAGVAAGQFGFTGTASGQKTVHGTATASLGFAAPASGVRTVKATAAGAFGFTATAIGARTVHGAASGQFGFSAPASGEGTSEPVTGAASGEFGFSAPASGRRIVYATATGTFGLTAPATGRRIAIGSAAAAFGFTAAASGKRSVYGAATAPFGFAAPIVVDTGIILRPNTGTVSRLATGTIVRPNTGIITRP